MRYWIIYIEQNVPKTTSFETYELATQFLKKMNDSYGGLSNPDAFYLDHIFYGNKLEPVVNFELE